MPTFEAFFRLHCHGGGMSLKSFLKSIKSDVSSIASTDFSIEIGRAKILPSADDQGLTFSDFDRKIKKCKLFKTCVLYIDLRNSTTISISHRPKTLAKMYSSFVRSMVKTSEYFGGSVKNIVGDRVMVLFERKDCFKNAINTAALLNTVPQKIMNKEFKNNEIRCGIGIDFGEMLVVKTGTIKQGKYKGDNRSLVWLGRPANVASKLTDVANKSEYESRPGVHLGYYYPFTKKWLWTKETAEEFVGKISKTIVTPIRHPDYLVSISPTTISNQKKILPILITNEVLEGLKKEAPNEYSIKNLSWLEQKVEVSGYSNKVWGSDLQYSVGGEI